MSGFPNHPDEVTTDWLAARLSDAGALDADEGIERLRWERIGTERGFAGFVARFTPTYSTPDAGPTTVIAKFPNPTSDDGVTPELARPSAERCAREGLFYRDIAPRLGAGVPCSYCGQSDIDASRFIILLESIPGEPGDSVVGCSAAGREAVIRAIARLHAMAWDRADEIAPWNVPRDPDHAAYVKRYEEQAPRFVEVHRQRIGDEALAVIDTLDARLSDILDAIERRSRTIIHGDLHLDNVIFEAEDKPCIIDWQSIATGPHGLDIALLGTDPQPDVTDGVEHMQWLVRVWHDELSAHGVVDYTLADAMRDAGLGLLRLAAGVVCGFAQFDPSRLDGRLRDVTESWFANSTLFRSTANWPM